MHNMIISQSHHFFHGLLVIGHCAPVSLCTDSRAYSCAFSLPTSEKPMWHFTRMNNWKKRVALFHQQRWKCSKETNSEKSGSKIRIGHKWIYTRNNWPWNVATAAAPEILDVHPDLVNEAQLTNINEESGCHGKDEDILGEVTQRKIFPFKEHSEIFHDIVSSKNKILEDDPIQKGT